MILNGISVDVRNIVENVGLEITNETNKELLANCPWCNDGRNNLSVNRESGLYHCWRCGAEDKRAHGTLIHLVASLRGITHIEAQEFVLRYGTEATAEQLLSRVEHAFSKRRSRSRLHSVQEEVDTYFNPRHPYWRSRGIRGHTATRYQLGFDARRNHAIIPVTVEDIPVAIIRRNVNKFGPRYIIPKDFQKERYLFGLDQCVGDGLYICEGPVDALKVAQAGYNAVAVLGSTFSEYQSKLVADYGPSHVTLMTDEDLGGEILSTKIWETYPMRNVYYTELGKKDPGKMNSDEIWEAVVTKKHVLGLYLAGLRHGHSLA